MTLPLKGEINLDDIMLQRHQTGGKDIVEDLHNRLEHEHGPGKISTSYDGVRTLKYEFEPTESANKLEPPMNQVDATELHNRDSLAATLYGLGGIDDELVMAIDHGRVALANSATIKRQADGTYAPIDPDDQNAINKCNSINRLNKFLSIFGKGG